MYLDLFDEEDVSIDLFDRKGLFVATVSFNTADCTFDTTTCCNTVFADEMSVDYDRDDCNETAQKLKKEQISCLTVSRAAMRNIHYAV